MSNFDPKNTIAFIRMTNQLLGLVDAYKGDKEITLHEVLEKFSEPYRKIGFDLEKHAFFNQHQMLTSMWAFIVLPKEGFYDELPDRSILELDAKWGLSDSEIDVDLKYFVRKLRNSISHARFKVSEDLSFTFMDKNNFNFQINANDLQMFVQALAYWVMTKDDELKGL